MIVCLMVRYGRVDLAKSSGVNTATPFVIDSPRVLLRRLYGKMPGGSFDSVKNQMALGPIARRT